MRQANGEVNPDLGKRWPGFAATLADTVSSVPPRGSEDPGYSTYWIDRALREVERRRGTFDQAPIQAGNITGLWMQGDKVRARSDYELFEDELMPVEKFVTVLREWRSALIAARSTAPAQFAESGRRNPYPG